MRGRGNKKTMEKGEAEEKTKRKYRIATSRHTGHGQLGMGQEDGVNSPIGEKQEGGKEHYPLTCQ